jgi:pyruvate/2-oxoglutarate/acetoin dehydrogenase E1 component
VEKKRKYVYWTKEEISLALIHAKAILDSKSNYYRSCKFLITEKLHHRSFYSITARLQREVFRLRRDPLLRIATPDIPIPLLYKPPENNDE